MATVALSGIITPTNVVTATSTTTLSNKTLTAPTIASANLTTALTLTGASGTSGQVLTSGGSGVAPTWTTASGGGSPAGSTTQLQYNNAGAFGGISGVTTDGTRMTASTTIGVGGATPSTSGAGITFPATQSDSTNANTLDDYEEGTWTPTQGSNLTVVGAFSSNGVYTKIGRSIVIIGRVKGDTSVAVATANAVMAGGLPFTPLISIGYSTGIALTAVGANFSGMYLYSDSTLNTNVVISAQPAIFFSATYYI
jgi:hypothetical protein